MEAIAVICANAGDVDRAAVGGDASAGRNSHPAIKVTCRARTASRPVQRDCARTRRAKCCVVMNINTHVERAGGRTTQAGQANQTIRSRDRCTGADAHPTVVIHACATRAVQGDCACAAGLNAAGAGDIDTVSQRRFGKPRAVQCDVATA